MVRFLGHWGLEDQMSSPPPWVDGNFTWGRKGSIYPAFCRLIDYWQRGILRAVTLEWHTNALWHSCSYSMFKKYLLNTYYVPGLDLITESQQWANSKIMMLSFQWAGDLWRFVEFIFYVLIFWAHFNAEDKLFCLELSKKLWYWWYSIVGVTGVVAINLQREKGRRKGQISPLWPGSHDKSWQVGAKGIPGARMRLVLGAQRGPRQEGSSWVCLFGVPADSGLDSPSPLGDIEEGSRPGWVIINALPLFASATLLKTTLQVLLSPRTLPLILELLTPLTDHKFSSFALALLLEWDFGWHHISLLSQVCWLITHPLWPSFFPTQHRSYVRETQVIVLREKQIPFNLSDCCYTIGYLQPNTFLTNVSDLPTPFGFWCH